jgi:soluble lytic murein transglycosylase
MTILNSTRFAKTTLIAVCALTLSLGGSRQGWSGELEDAQRSTRLNTINGLIYQWTSQSLPRAFRPQSKVIAQAIIDESFKHDFDPVFVSSVILNESSFDPDKIGSVGEIGLMQVRPETGQWIARKDNLNWRGKASLHDPVTNIRLGTAYLSYLRVRFDSHARLYLAAYNMGQGNVKAALGRKVWPKDYALRVMKYYVSYYRRIRD